jgi:ribosomal protein S18 acetylase RimI-like enzyme
MADVYEIERAGSSDDDVLAEHYLGLWHGYGVPPGHLLPDARQRVLAFLAEARAELAFGGFVGRTGGAVVASACCGVRRSPYPEVIRPEHRKVGYVWSLYVDPRHRRRGLARRLDRGLSRPSQEHRLPDGAPPLLRCRPAAVSRHGLRSHE